MNTHNIAIDLINMIFYIVLSAQFKYMHVRLALHNARTVPVEIILLCL